ncbi:hypothetical protein ABZ471_40655 [Streptomyces sp. NPDC005728]|uniref:hypothetical protein n=1 Tax=Streptomyces sp. NPDC005728 TaxID=3157054 RepID=UPI0033C867B1
MASAAQADQGGPEPDQGGPEPDQGGPEPDQDGPEPDQDGPEQVARQHAGLSAWGTLLAGIAAFLTLFTACVSTYVAFATYKHGQRQDVEKQEEESADFAYRVLVSEVGALSSTGKEMKLQVENRNLYPIGDLGLRVWALPKVEVNPSDRLSDPTKPQVVDDFIFGPSVVPACARLTFDVAAEVTDDGGREYFGMVFAVAYFTDRHGAGWVSHHGALFQRGSSEDLLGVPSLSKDPFSGEKIRYDVTRVRDVRGKTEKADNCK